MDTKLDWEVGVVEGAVDMMGHGEGRDSLVMSE